MRVIAIFGGVALLASSILCAVQDPPRPASMDGVVVRAGAGTPLAGARITITLAAPDSASGQSGAGGIPAELQSDILNGIRPQPDGLTGGPASPSTSSAASPAGRPVPPEPIAAAVTDAQGHFSFNDLKPGRYTVQVAANGYIPQGPGRGTSLGPDASVILGSGEVRTDLTFSLIPAGNISGRLLDVSQEPVSGVPVRLLRAVYSASGQRSLQTVSNTKTDDRGEYRIYWVTPGRYYLHAGNAVRNDVMVMMMPASAGLTRLDAGPNAFPLDVGAVFFPGAADIDGARAVTVGPGQEISGIGWIVPPNPGTHAVRGRVIDARTGNPPTRADVVAYPVGTGFGSDVSGFAFGLELALRGRGSGDRYDPATGRLELSGLVPGSYEILVLVPDESRAKAGGDEGGNSLSGIARVTVGDADVDGVSVTVSPPVTIQGQVTVEGELPPLPAPRGGSPVGAPGGAAPGSGLGLSVVLIPSRQDMASVILGSLGNRDGGRGAAAADGSFRLRSAAGEYRIAVTPMPAGGYLKMARMAGVDLLESPLLLPGLVGPIEVIVSMHGGEIQGVVVDAHGAAAPNRQVVLVPNRASHRVDLFKTATSDAAGRFTMKGIPPGGYKLFSWDDANQPPYAWFDPELLENYQDRGVSVHISESSVEYAEVKLIPAGGAQ